MLIYVVKPGDTIYKIARQYDVSPEQIIDDNQLDEPEQLVIGQTIVVMTDNLEHTAVAGDTLYKLAAQYGVSLDRMKAYNSDIANYNQIRPGQSIVIPPVEKLGTIAVNGYAYPTISPEVLENWLPSLTYLSIFSYEVRPTGSLSEIHDTDLINRARRANVATKMVITNIEAGGSFSSDLARAILNNRALQNTLINNVISVMQNKGYEGLDIDFEYLYPQDREAYNEFLRLASNRLKALGFSISSAIAPKISAQQKGLLYEAHDYSAHGRYMDYAIIMTYEWGHLYGPPSPVSPVNEIKKVLNYTVTAIPSKKILMGMPNYGYNWVLPYVPNTAAEILNNVAAVDLAREVGANIQYDTVLQAPFFKYYDNTGNQHIVWFEDARSVLAKLQLVKQYNLGGVSYWTANYSFPQNNLILQSLYNIQKVIS